MGTDELRAVRARVESAGVSGSPDAFLEALKDGGFATAEFFAADSVRLRRRYRAFWIDGELLRGIFYAPNGDGVPITEYEQPLSALRRINPVDSLDHTSVPACLRRTFIIRFEDGESINLDGGRTDALGGPVIEFIDALKGIDTHGAG